MTTQSPIRFPLFGALLFMLPLQEVQAADPPSNQGLPQQVAQLQAQVAALQSQLSTLIAISPYVSLQTVNGQPTVRFNGANVQVVNGLVSTSANSASGGDLNLRNAADYVQ